MKPVFLLVAILIFGILIAVHELGHFVVAKLCGVRVNEFAIGMGPVLFRRQRGETLYSLRLLPLGGFCAMEGERFEYETNMLLMMQRQGIPFVEQPIA
ncbi:MAG: site-2 protease family protein, partial [Ruminococcaceae bacterium]|nr:site-2 protease family protein [Oscillospiraceae bacterium]